MPSQPIVARVFRALVGVTWLIAGAAHSDAAVFNFDFGAACATMTLAGRTITCSDGTTLTIDGSVAPNCPQFALGSQGANYTLVCATPNATGLWWRPAEDGRGTWVSHQGDTIFGVDYAYDAANAPRWRTLVAHKAVDGTFTGTVYATTGPPFTAPNFDPQGVMTFTLGPGWIALDDANHLRADFFDGTDRALVRQQFGTLPACSFGLHADPATLANYTDLWWNPGESGWGVSLAHQGDTIFAAWYTYGVDGSPMWLVATTHKTVPGTYTGDIYRAVGPAGPSMQATSVGSATFTFATGTNATFAYSVQLAGMPAAVPGAKSITRQLFIAPGAACQ